MMQNNKYTCFPFQFAIRKQVHFVAICAKFVKSELEIHQSLFTFLACLTHVFFKHYGPFLHYVSTFVDFFRPTHSLCQHKNSTERHQKLPFSGSTQSFSWRTIGKVPYTIGLTHFKRTFYAPVSSNFTCSIVELQ